MKNKSIFTKHVLIYLAIFSLSFIILGGSIYYAVSRHVINEKKTELLTKTRQISEEYSNSVYSGILNVESLQYDIRTLEEYLDSQVFLADKNKKIYVASEGFNKNIIGQTVTNDIINGVFSGDVVTFEGYFKEIFNDKVLFVGYPIVVGKQVLGGVFTFCTIPTLEKSISGITNVVLICMIVSALIGAVLLYLFSKRLVKPIKEVSKASRIIADGNFDKKIEYKSNDEIGDLVKSFNYMAENLDKQEKLRRDFIANISHDLRSPLTSIQGFLNAIIDGTADECDREKYIKIALEETKRLSELTNGILMLNNIENNKITIDFEKFDINDLIRETVSRFKPRIEDKKLEIELIFEEKETYVYSDGEKIFRIFQNLLDNAIKFSNISSKIIVETNIDNPKNKVYVSVKDFGVGLSEEEIKHVFERFYKADSSRNKEKACGGIGLSIVKEFIKLLGEEIDLKSKKGEYTIFKFSISLYQEMK